MPMPSKSLFELVPGNLVEIVDYAYNHNRGSGPPPKLAVNTNSWWYNSRLTLDAVQHIRKDTRPGVIANPIESNFLHYFVPILHLGIQLHFVFDGPGRLHNGGKAHPGYEAPTELLRQVLTQLAIPWHDAPAEAEAECAKMEAEGLVDAVWSEDGDALAFGSRTVIKSYREVRTTRDRSREPRNTYFKVYRLEDIEENYPGMNREGFILHALLCRAGKLSGGLPDFEAKDALEAAQHGLGRSMLEAATSKAQFQDWIDSKLKTYLEERTFRDYPTYEQLKDYVSPVVSAKETLSSLVKSKPVFGNEKEVYSFINKHLRWTEDKWIRWIVPMRIVQLLVPTPPGEESKHDHYDLKSDDMKKNPKNPKASYLICQATTVDTSCILNPRAEFRTLAWILRKSNLNRTPSLHKWLGTPESGQNAGASFGKAVDNGGDPSGASGMRAQTPPTPPSSAEDERLMLTRSTGFPTPTSNERVHDNGEGSSKTASRPHLRTPRTPSSSRSKRSRPARATNGGLQTPVSNEINHNNGGASSRALASRAAQQSSPTPAPKRYRHPLNSLPKMGLLLTKPNVDRVRPSLKSPIEFELENGKGKGKEIEAGSISNRSTKRVRSSSSESDTLNENVSKKIKKQLDSTSSPEESEEPFVISSQTTYDSISSQDLLDIALPTNTTKPAVLIERSESDDEYGSVPSTPELRALP